MLKGPAITVFTPSLEPGGAEKVTVKLVNGFIERNIKVDLIIATPYAALKNAIKKEVNIIEFNHSRSIYSLFSLIRYLKINKPQIVLSHLARANRITILANLLSGSPSKVYVVEHTTQSVASEKHSLKTRIISHIGYKYLYPKAENIVHVSKGAASDLERIFSWKRDTIKVIYNPIVDKELLNQKNGNVPHVWLEESQPPVILGVGKLKAVKNYSMLIDAFDIVRKKMNCRLMILGQGPEKEYLEEKIQKLDSRDDIQLAGYVENPYDYMRNASVFVLSSLREGLPSVIIEALACGCPVVSTNCKSGPEEILENGRYGKLVPIDGIHNMADAIIDTIKNPPPRQTLIERAKYYSIERSVDNYLKLFNIL